MSTETKDKTPIQKAIKLVEVRINDLKEINSELANSRRRGYEYTLNELKHLLPYEKQWAEEIFNAGYKRGEDQTNVINLFEGQVFPDFKTLYSKYEK